MNSYKKLIGNSAVFAIGNLGSKLISIILVPLYTYYMTTSEYGIADIVTTTTSMLLPIISLSIFDAVLRFVMDKDQNNQEVFTNALIVTIIGSIISALIFLLLNYFSVLTGLLGYTLAILILQSFQSLISQFTRAIGEIKIYSLNGIIMTLAICGLNILFLIKFRMGVNGYLLSIVVGNLISIIFMVYSLKIYKYINVNKTNLQLIKKMLVYSAPLIPNAFMWWIMNASSRYFIIFFLGVSANGLFALANKIPSLLSILNNIFFQAWQLSAIEEYDSKNKSKFYSDVFDYFSTIMIIGTSAILVVLKYIMKNVISSDFYLAWKYVPVLLLGVVFSSFSSFLGTNYIAAKQTKGVFRTSIIGGFISILASLVFIPLFNVNGAGIAIMLSFIAIWIIRLYDTKKFIELKLDIIHIAKNLFILAIQILILYLKLNVMREFIIEFILFVILILSNNRLYKPIKSLLKGISYKKTL